MVDQLGRPVKVALLDLVLNALFGLGAQGGQHASSTEVGAPTLAASQCRTSTSLISLSKASSTW